MKLLYCFVVLFAAQNGFCIEQRGAWIDIPTSSFAMPEGYQNGKISQLIDDYHHIAKTNLTLIEKRTIALEQIHAEISKVMENVEPSVNKKLKNLDVLVQKKCWYLKEISKIYNDKPYEVFLEVDLKDTQYKPLMLVNKILFDAKLPIYWGLFWLETLDPCHRFLTAHYIKWKKEGSTIPFFMWLEEQEISYNAIQVTFLEQDQIEKSQLKIVDGLFIHHANHKLADFSHVDREYLFVITLDKKLLVVEGSESIRHSSISHGKPVLGSGALKIKNGKLIYLDAESGHYQPTPIALFQVLQILAEQGVRINYRDVQLKYYHNGQVIRENASLFVEKFKKEKTIHKIDSSNKTEKFKI